MKPLFEIDYKGAQPIHIFGGGTQEWTICRNCGRDHYRSFDWKDGADEIDCACGQHIFGKVEPRG